LGVRLRVGVRGKGKGKGRGRPSELAERSLRMAASL
jgi:hypothetical protein